MGIYGAGVLSPGDRTMDSWVSVHVIVEGATENRFVKNLLHEYLAERKVHVTASLFDKPGQRGGDVRFCRALKDIGNFLKGRPDRYVTLLFDYYGVKEWPGLTEAGEAGRKNTPESIAKAINDATLEEVVDKIDDRYRPKVRFIPNVMVHEFEALLFSGPDKLAEGLGVNPSFVEGILEKFDQKPERINNSRNTSPARRIETLADSVARGKYKKTTTGISIAAAIGIDQMRKQCDVFNSWLVQLEELSQRSSPR